MTGRPLDGVAPMEKTICSPDGEELMDGVELGGVATFLGESDESGATLFI